MSIGRHKNTRNYRGTCVSKVRGGWLMKDADGQPFLKFKTLREFVHCVDRARPKP